jgi:hypothetical protein
LIGVIPNVFDSVSVILFIVSNFDQSWLSAQVSYYTRKIVYFYELNPWRCQGGIFETSAWRQKDE